jgi:hypothetical protein
MIRARSCALVALTLLAGCQLTPEAPVARPALQLMESQPLVLAPGCDASGSSSVVIEFIVRMDGSTDALKLSPAPECVREALTAWVSSFRYLPPAADIPTGVEWLLVSARRGS